MPRGVWSSPAHLSMGALAAAAAAKQGHNAPNLGPAVCLVSNHLCAARLLRDTLSLLAHRPRRPRRPRPPSAAVRRHRCRSRWTSSRDRPTLPAATGGLHVRDTPRAPCSRALPPARAPRRHLSCASVCASPVASSSLTVFARRIAAPRRSVHAGGLSGGHVLHVRRPPGAEANRARCGPQLHRAPLMCASQQADAVDGARARRQAATRSRARQTSSRVRAKGPRGGAHHVVVCCVWLRAALLTGALPGPGAVKDTKDEVVGAVKRR
jgi:hypothetical protein